MSLAGPKFAPADGDVPVRLRRVEDFLGRHDEWSRAAAQTHNAEMADQCARIGLIEEKVQGILLAIGQMRVKLGVVFAGAAAVGGLIAHLVAKMFGAT